ncbi:MAG TPA: ABC transporter permease [Candidatus Avimonoglobus intestinipullorum]|uniref:ABC transporter permease n=1 Tax=Candidatus Avimonoglobus intestinipullorum TaxID=2840699 RepID=A0A9D1LU72_9FIRM|nr:ABC transporter permease [Candidatus Avimonoglobus intestinipullorum]
MFDILISVLEQGMIFGIMALGVYISYKILDFPDLSVDGTFPLGAAVTAALITAGVNPWLCLLVAFLAGCAAGTVTGLLNVKLKIKDLLSGILMMTALYSINYRIAGAPNKFLMGEPTIFSLPEGLPQWIVSYRYLILIAVIALFAKFALDWYLNTKSGFLLKSAGDNEGLVVTLAQNPGRIKIIGLAIANGLVALAGALNCQRVMQFDIQSGTGTMVMGLAAVIIGTAVFQKVRFLRVTTGVILGMIIYKACITLAIGSGLQSSDTNLVVTVLFVAALVLNDVVSKKKGKGGHRNAAAH